MAVDVLHFPHSTFKSTGVELEGAELWRRRGLLALHGVIRPVALEVERFGPVISRAGETSVGLRLSTRINREDFGMSWNTPLVGGLMVGTEVSIVGNLEADLAEV